MINLPPKLFPSNQLFSDLLTKCVVFTIFFAKTAWKFPSFPSCIIISCCCVEKQWIHLTRRVERKFWKKFSWKRWKFVKHKMIVNWRKILTKVVFLYNFSYSRWPASRSYFSWNRIHHVRSTTAFPGAHFIHQWWALSIFQDKKIIRIAVLYR